MPTTITPTADTTTDARPTFPGTLSIQTDRDRRPILMLTFKCPSCRQAHHHTWTGDMTDPPAHRVAHCTRESSPYRRPHGSGYLIHPRPDTANENTHARYVAQLGEYEHQAVGAAAAVGAGAGAGAGAG